MLGLQIFDAFGVDFPVVAAKTLFLAFFKVDVVTDGKFHERGDLERALGFEPDGAGFGDG